METVFNTTKYCTNFILFIDSKQNQPRRWQTWYENYNRLSLRSPLPVPFKKGVFQRSFRSWVSWPTLQRQGTRWMKRVLVCTLFLTSELCTNMMRTNRDTSCDHLKDANENTGGQNDSRKPFNHPASLHSDKEFG